MLVRFWGVRRGAPAPARSTPSRFGFHTACVEVRDEATGALLILDAGTGLEPLEATLRCRPVPVVILLSHVHPADTPPLARFLRTADKRWSVRIVAPVAAGLSSERIRFVLRTQAAEPASDALERSVVALLEVGQTEINGFHIRSVTTNFQGGAVAYRIRGESGDLVYAPGHRFGDLTADEAFTSFAFNSGATIFGEYAPDEGDAEDTAVAGAPWRQSTEFASATGAGQLWLFRYAADSSDESLEDLEKRARRVYPATRVAREGDSFSL